MPSKKKDAGLKNRVNLYAFGMPMPGRTFNPTEYRYGFQGQEKIDEIKGNGNYIDYQYRGYDPRIGRFISTDPLEKDYPMYSPYHFSSNQPIHAPELEGKESAWDLNSRDPSFQALDKEGQEKIRDIQGEVGFGILGSLAGEMVFAKIAGYAYGAYKSFRTAVPTIVKAEKVIQRVFLKAEEFAKLPNSGKIDPSKIRYSQNSIKSEFKNGSSIDDLAKQLKEGKIDPSKVDPIRIVEKDGKIFSLDNRRLKAFQDAGVEVPYKKLDAIPKGEEFKFTTKNEGVDIIVR